MESFYRRHHQGETGRTRYGTTIEGSERGRWFSERVGKGVRVLDLGCRDGTMTKAFCEGNQVVGVDIDTTALAAAKEHLRIETIACNVNTHTLPFPDHDFDVVVCGEVLEHLQISSLVVTEVMRVLRPGGKFLGSVPNAFRLPNRLKFLAGIQFETDPTHLHQFSEADLRSLMAAYGTVEFDYLGGRRWRDPHPSLKKSRLLGRLMATVLLWDFTKKT